MHPPDNFDKELMITKVFPLKRNMIESDDASTMFVVHENSSNAHAFDCWCVGHTVFAENINSYNFYKMIEKCGKWTIEYLVCSSQPIPKDINDLDTSVLYPIQAKIYGHDVVDCFMVGFSDSVRQLLQVNSPYDPNVRFSNLYEEVSKTVLNSLFNYYAFEMRVNMVLSMLYNRWNKACEMETHIDSILPMIFNIEKLTNKIIKLCVEGTPVKLLVETLHKDLWPNNLPISEHPELIGSIAFKWLATAKGTIITFDKGVQVAEPEIRKIDEQFADYTVFINPQLETNDSLENGLRYSYLKLIDTLRHMPYTDIGIEFKLRDKSQHSWILNFIENKTTGYDTNAPCAADHYLAYKDMADMLEEIASGFKIPRTKAVDIDVTLCKTNNEITVLFFRVLDRKTGAVIAKNALYLDMTICYILTPAITVTTRNKYAFEQ